MAAGADASGRGYTRARTMLGIGLIVISGTIVATYLPWGNAGHEIWNMPEGMGALLGSSIGLLGVGISGLVGFRSLIRSQEHAAELNRKRDASLVAHDVVSVIAALSGELLSIKETLSGTRVSLDLSKAMFEQFRKQYGSNRVEAKAPALLPKIATPIYDAHVSKIGLLQPATAHKIAAAYPAIRSLVSPQSDANFAFPDVMIATCDLSKAMVEATIVKIDGACATLTKSMDD